MTAKETLKNWFSNLKKPTQAHFWAWLDSFWHKSEKIPMQNIDGLDNVLKDTVSNTQFQGLLDDFKTYSTLLNGKVDKESDKGLSANDFTNELKNKLETLQPAPMLEYLQFQNDRWGQVGYNDGSGNGVSISGLRELLQNFDEEKAPEREQYLKDLIDNKVDKEQEKGLSANDFTDDLKNKLETLQPAPMLEYLQFQNDNWGQVGYNDGSGNGVSIHGLREVLQDFDEEKAPEREQKIDEKINEFQTNSLQGIIYDKIEEVRINTIVPQIIEEISHFENHQLQYPVERILQPYIDQIMRLEADIMQLRQEMETLKIQTENQQSEIDFLRSSLP